MTKQEFSKAIKKAEEGVCNDPMVGLCFRLDNINSEVRSCFNKYFNPDNEAGHWLDDYCKQGDNMNELERRLMFLECFKQWALCYKEYERF